MNVPWAVKHIPSSSAEIPQQTAIARLKYFLDNFKKEKKKAVLLYGPPGTGKTSAVQVLARELGLELFEVNASDDRNAEQIKLRVGSALKQRSLFFTSKLIVIEEIDGIAGAADRGGTAELSSLLENPAFPVVLTANDPWDQKLSKIRKICNLIEFQEIPLLQSISILESVCSKEGIAVSREQLKKLAIASKGDLRAAITDIQTISYGRQVRELDLESIGERERAGSIMAALTKVLKGTNAAEASKTFDSIDMDVDEVFLWLDYNMPKEYTNPADLLRAFDAMSRADVFRGRIRRWQYWRFLVYIYALLSAGVSSAKDSRYQKFVKYEQTSRLLKIWMSNRRLHWQKSVAQKLAVSTHTSTKKAFRTIPLLKLACRKKEFVKQLVDSLDLSEEEEEWLVAK